MEPRYESPAPLSVLVVEPHPDGADSLADLLRLVGHRVTGVGGQKAEVNSLDAGFDHHILKPADPKEILRDFAAFIKTMEPVVLELT